MSRRLRVRENLLWVDCLAALTGGAVVLVFGESLASLHALPLDLVRFIGVVNLTYGGYSLSLALSRRRPMALIGLLVVANAGWSLVCMAMAWHFMRTATFWGLAQVIGEGAFVGGLAGFEWKYRALLRNRPQ